ncbi:hypothetical protein A6J63_000610 [Yersinia enterocolitica]|nr:hypothetical protein A6J63_000610 [Yersinia enterocolitica]
MVNQLVGQIAKLRFILGNFHTQMGHKARSFQMENGGNMRVITYKQIEWATKRSGIFMPPLKID